jgi:phage-related protein
MKARQSRIEGSGSRSDGAEGVSLGSAATSFLYLKIEIHSAVPWQVEILDETVAAEIAGLPADMQARFIRLAERIAAAGLENLSEPHVKHLEGKLWELRLTGRDGIARALYVTAIGRRVVVVRAFVKKTQKTPRAEIELALRRAKEVR